MLDENGFIIGKKAGKALLKMAVRSVVKPVEIMTEAELNALPAGSVFIFDVETYVNFWFVAFKSLENGKFVTFERSPDFDFNETKLRFMLWKFCLVGFNSKGYDIPMIELAVRGATCKELKEASDFIVKSGINYGTKKVTAFDFERQYKLQIGNYNHIDLFNVCPVNGGLTATPASLKLYAGRLHAPRLQDLPFPEDHVLTQADAEIVRPYCCNDLENTQLLFEELAPEIKLRIEMTEEYGVDLRSKSDAQIAETVVASELRKIMGYDIKPPCKMNNFRPPDSVAYNVPDFIFFKTPQLQDCLERIKNLQFPIDAAGSPQLPDYLNKLRIKLGKSVYKLGMGGLHSTESKVSYFAKDGFVLADNDVESFYPRTILNQKLMPSHLGEAFLFVYEKIVQTRINGKTQNSKAKKAGDKEAAKKWKVVADSLKIVINGLFGKFGNKYSLVYSPQLLLQVTITGQLVLLMLIEELESRGIDVVSGNTDGFVSYYHESRHSEVREVIRMWEEHTGYKTEETQYSAVLSRDVNNYIAVKKEGGEKEARFLDERLGVKSKGAFCERGSALNSVLSKNPETLICNDAVMNYIIHKTPVAETVKNCRDIRRFISVKNVRGGGQKNGYYLGKVVRWYYAKNEAGYISYANSGNKVGKTDGAKPLMDLPPEFPNDLDFDWYVAEATKMLFGCAILKQKELI